MEFPSTNQFINSKEDDNQANQKVACKVYEDMERLSKYDSNPVKRDGLTITGEVVMDAMFGNADTGEINCSVDDCFNMYGDLIRSCTNSSEDNIRLCIEYVRAFGM